MAQVTLSAPLLLFHSCHIRQAVSYLTSSVDHNRDAFSQGSEEDIHLLLRGLFELGREAELKERVERLKDRSLLEPEKRTAQTFVNLASGYVYLGKAQEGLFAYNRAFDLLKNDDQSETFIRALVGSLNASRVLSGAGATLEKLKKTKIEYSQNLTAQNKMAIGLLKGGLLCDIGDDVAALNEFWNCYDLLAQSKSLYQYYYLMFYLYQTHARIGEHEQARLYFDLLKKGMDREELCWLWANIANPDEPRANLQKQMTYLALEGRIQLPGGHWVELGRQNVLKTLFERLLESGGQGVSLSEIADAIWGGTYDPAIHDNKIYVTIRRLRQLLEPNAAHPQLINKDKKGYLISVPVRRMRNLEGNL